MRGGEETSGGERGARRRQCGEIGGVGVGAIFSFLFFSLPFFSSLFFLSFPSLSFPFSLFFVLQVLLANMFSFCFSVCVLVSFPTLDLAFELLSTRKYAPPDTVDKRRTLKHCKRRNWGDKDEIRARSLENVNRCAIAVRLHAKMNYIRLLSRHAY